MSTSISCIGWLNIKICLVSKSVLPNLYYIIHFSKRNVTNILFIATNLYNYDISKFILAVDNSQCLHYLLSNYYEISLKVMKYCDAAFFLSFKILMLGSTKENICQLNPKMAKKKKNPNQTDQKKKKPYRRKSSQLTNILKCRASLLE